MKKLIFSIVMLFVAISVNAQFKYNSDGSITLGDITAPYKYITAWEGRGHYFHYSGSSSGNTWPKIYLGTNGPRIAANSTYIRFYDTDAEVYHDVYVSAIYESSDQRLKTNISNIQSPLNKTLQLRPVHYSLLNTNQEKSSKEDIGFIAQELENIIPEAVSTDDSGNKMVNYRTIIPILTGAIQELSTKIAELEAQIAELKR